MHLDSPVCHGLPAQKSGKYGGLGKNRNTQTRPSTLAPLSDHGVAPLADPRLAPLSDHGLAPIPRS